MVNMKREKRDSVREHASCSMEVGEERGVK